MARIGLTEKTEYIYNPLPKVTDREILKRANLDADASARSPFSLTWTYGYGLEKEVVILEPGGSFPLRGKEIREAFLDLKQYGVLVVDDPENVPAKDKVRAIRVARNRYRDNGKTKISALRKLRNLTKEEMEDEYRHDYWPYYYNQACSEVLTEHLRELEELAELEEEERNGADQENVAAAAG